MSQDNSLIEYLERERGISKECLERLQKERIDEGTLPLLSEEELENYLPLKGDRIAARQFCSKKGEKNTLLNRLRRTFQMQTEEVRKAKAIKLKGNLNASKPTRTVEVGWLNYNSSRESYVQVRSQCGGGTRIVGFQKQDTTAYVLEKGKSLFFPNGRSKKGPASDFIFHVCDFEEKPVEETVTISELYTACQMRTLRLYICTKRIESETLDENMPAIQGPKRKKRKRLCSPREIFSVTESDPNQTATIPMIGVNTSNVTESETTGSSTQGAVVPRTWGNTSNLMQSESAGTSTQISFGPRTRVNRSSVRESEIAGISTETSIVPNGANFANEIEALQTMDLLLLASNLVGVSQPSNMNHETDAFRYTDNEVSFNVPMASYDETVNSNIHSPVNPLSGNTNLSSVTNKEEEQLNDDNAVVQSATNDNSFSQSSRILETAAAHFILPEPATNVVEMNVHRGAAFQEVIGYFKDPSIMKKTLKITRVLPNGIREMAEDSGGVLRDLLSEFWTSFYNIATLGRESKVPTIRHDFAATEWEAVGRVLVYGYEKTKYWPVMLAQTFIMQCLFPDKEPNKQSLLSDFYHYVSKQDMQVFKLAYEDYDKVQFDELLDSLDLYECKTNPNSENTKSIILEIAHTVIIQKPMFVSSSMKSVLGELKLNEEQIETIYRTLIPTNRAVVKLLKFPEHMDSQEQDVAKHLQRYIRDLEEDKLKLLLRYITGSDLLTMDKISVEFSVMHGLERRPIAHRVHVCYSCQRLTKAIWNSVQNLIMS